MERERGRERGRERESERDVWGERRQVVDELFSDVRWPAAETRTGYRPAPASWARSRFSGLNI
jgi:hypothetical protein